eukprot:gene4703-3396_t
MARRITEGRKNRGRSSISSVRGSETDDSWCAPKNSRKQDPPEEEIVEIPCFTSSKSEEVPKKRRRSEKRIDGESPISTASKDGGRDSAHEVWLQPESQGPADAAYMRGIQQATIQWWYQHRRRDLPWRRPVNQSPTPCVEETIAKKEAGAQIKRSGTAGGGVIYATKTGPFVVKEELPEDEQVASEQGGGAPTLPPNPYEIWVSEVMSQQTQMGTVIEYFDKWMAKFPTVEALAGASEEEVRAVWAGMGYYRRALYLLRGAQYVVKLSQEAGSDQVTTPPAVGTEGSKRATLPDTVKGLEKVPGIGPYTAAAIASICYGEPVAAVDGNHVRVLSRLRAERFFDPKKPQNLKRAFAWGTYLTKGDPATKTPSEGMKREAEQDDGNLAPVPPASEGQQPASAPQQERNKTDIGWTCSDPGALNQGLMEIGAGICRPNGPPLCSLCPLQPYCGAYAALKRGEIPAIEGIIPLRAEPTPKRKDHVMCVVHQIASPSVGGKGHKMEAGQYPRHRYVIVRRAEDGLLAGMLEFPSLTLDPIAVSDATAAAEGKNQPTRPPTSLPWLGMEKTRTKELAKGVLEMRRWDDEAEGKKRKRNTTKEKSKTSALATPPPWLSSLSTSSPIIAAIHSLCLTREGSIPGWLPPTPMYVGTVDHIFSHIAMTVYIFLCRWEQTGEKQETETPRRGGPHDLEHTLCERLAAALLASSSAAGGATRREDSSAGDEAARGAMMRGRVSVISQEDMRGAACSRLMLKVAEKVSLISSRRCFFFVCGSVEKMKKALKPRNHPLWGSLILMPRISRIVGAAISALLSKHYYYKITIIFKINNLLILRTPHLFSFFSRGVGRTQSYDHVERQYFMVNEVLVAGNLLSLQLHYKDLSSLITATVINIISPPSSFLSSSAFGKRRSIRTQKNNQLTQVTEQKKTIRRETILVHNLKSGGDTGSGILWPIASSHFAEEGGASHLTYISEEHNNNNKGKLLSNPLHGHFSLDMRGSLEGSAAGVSTEDLSGEDDEPMNVGGRHCGSDRPIYYYTLRESPPSSTSMSPSYDEGEEEGGGRDHPQQEMDVNGIKKGILPRDGSVSSLLDSADSFFGDEEVEGEPCSSSQAQPSAEAKRTVRDSAPVCCAGDVQPHAELAEGNQSSRSLAEQDGGTEPRGQRKRSRTAGVCGAPRRSPYPGKRRQQNKKTKDGTCLPPLSSTACFLTATTHDDPSLEPTFGSSSVCFRIPVGDGGDADQRNEEVLLSVRYGGMPPYRTPLPPTQIMTERVSLASTSGSTGSKWRAMKDFSITSVSAQYRTTTLRTPPRSTAATEPAIEALGEVAVRCEPLPVCPTSTLAAIASWPRLHPALRAANPLLGATDAAPPRVGHCAVALPLSTAEAAVFLTAPRVQAAPEPGSLDREEGDRSPPPPLASFLSSASDTVRRTHLLLSLVVGGTAALINERQERVGTPTLQNCRFGGQVMSMPALCVTVVVETRGVGSSRPPTGHGPENHQLSQQQLYFPLLSTPDLLSTLDGSVFATLTPWRGGRSDSTFTAASSSFPSPSVLSFLLLGGTNNGWRPLPFSIGTIVDLDLRTWTWSARELTTYGAEPPARFGHSASVLPTDAAIAQWERSSTPAATAMGVTGAASLSFLSSCGGNHRCMLGGACHGKNSAPSAAGDLILVFGGIGVELEYLHDAYVLHASTHVWREILLPLSPLTALRHSPRGRAFHSAVVVCPTPQHAATASRAAPAEKGNSLEEGERPSNFHLYLEEFVSRCDGECADGCSPPRTAKETAALPSGPQLEETGGTSGPTNRQAAALGSGELVILGGEGSRGVEDTVWSLDLRTRIWRQWEFPITRWTTDTLRQDPNGPRETPYGYAQSEKSCARDLENGATHRWGGVTIQLPRVLHAVERDILEGSLDEERRRRSTSRKGGVGHRSAITAATAEMRAEDLLQMGSVPLERMLAHYTPYFGCCVGSLPQALVLTPSLCQTRDLPSTNPPPCSASHQRLLSPDPPPTSGWVGTVVLLGGSASLSSTFLTTAVTPCGSSLRAIGRLYLLQAQRRKVQGVSLPEVDALSYVSRLHMPFHRRHHFNTTSTKRNQLLSQQYCCATAIFLLLLAPCVCASLSPLFVSYKLHLLGLGTPPTSRPPTMPYTVDLCAGAMIQSTGNAFHHVGILVGYPKDFQHLLPSDVLEVLQLDPECQYVVSKRNYGGAANLFGISNSNGNQGGIVLEELSKGFLDGAEPCPFPGERRSFPETVSTAIAYYLNPEGQEGFCVLRANCQDFAIRVATKDMRDGLVDDQRKKVMAGSWLGVVGGVALAPVTLGGSLVVAATSFEIYAYNAIKYFSCRVEVREPIFCSPAPLESLRILLSLFLFLYLSTYYVCRPLHSCPITLSNGGGGEGTVRGTGTSTTAVPLLELTAPRKIKISGECAVARLTSLLLLVVNAVVGAAWELSPGCSVWPVLKDSYTPEPPGLWTMPMDLLHFSSFVLPCLSTPSCSLCLCFPFASLCVLGTPPTSRPPTMPYTVDLCAGAMIQSTGKAFHHVGILVGYPKDFQHLLPSDVLEVLQLDPECQYVVSKRNYGGAANLFGISNSNGNQGGIVLEELSKGFLDGAEPCPFPGERRSFPETVSTAIAYYLNPEGQEGFCVLRANCQDFAIRVATKDMRDGLVDDQRKKVMAGSWLGVVGGVALAPVTLGGSLVVAATSFEIYAYNAIKYFSAKKHNPRSGSRAGRDPPLPAPVFHEAPLESLRILLSLFLFLYLSTYYVCRPLHSCPITLSSGGGGEGTVRGTGTSTTAVPLLELTAPRKIKISGECAVARLTSLLLLVVNAVVGAAWELSPGCSVWPVLKDSYTPRTAGAVDYGGLPCALLEPMDLLHFSSFVLPCLSTPSCSLCLCFPFASLCVLGTPPTSRPPTMPYTVDLCAGAMIQSTGKAFHHVGILVGYPKDFQHLLPSDVLEVLQLDPECQYVVSKRNYGGAANLFGISNSNGNQGGIVLEELSKGFLDGAEPCPFPGERRSFPETVSTAIAYYLNPEGQEGFCVLRANCQDFAIRVATKDMRDGLVDDQRKKVMAGSWLGVVGGVALAPVTLGGSLVVAATSFEIYAYNAIKYFSCRVEVREPIFCSPSLRILLSLFLFLYLSTYYVCRPLHSCPITLSSGGGGEGTVRGTGTSTTAVPLLELTAPRKIKISGECAVARLTSLLLLVVNAVVGAAWELSPGCSVWPVLKDSYTPRTAGAVDYGGLPCALLEPMDLLHFSSFVLPCLSTPSCSLCLCFPFASLCVLGTPPTSRPPTMPYTVDLCAGAMIQSTGKAFHHVGILVGYPKDFQHLLPSDVLEVLQLDPECQYVVSKRNYGGAANLFGISNSNGNQGGIVLEELSKGFLDGAEPCPFPGERRSFPETVSTAIAYYLNPEGQEGFCVLRANCQDFAIRVMAGSWLGVVGGVALAPVTLGGSLVVAATSFEIYAYNAIKYFSAKKHNPRVGSLRILLSLFLFLYLSTYYVPPLHSCPTTLSSGGGGEGPSGYRHLDYGGATAVCLRRCAGPAHIASLVGGKCGCGCGVGIVSRVLCLACPEGFVYPRTAGAVDYGGLPCALLEPMDLLHFSSFVLPCLSTPSCSLCLCFPFASLCVLGTPPTSRPPTMPYTVDLCAGAMIQSAGKAFHHVGILVGYPKDFQHLLPSDVLEVLQLDPECQYVVSKRNYGGAANLFGISNSNGNQGGIVLEELSKGFLDGAEPCPFPGERRSFPETVSTAIAYYLNPEGQEGFCVLRANCQDFAIRVMAGSWLGVVGGVALAPVTLGGSLVVAATSFEIYAYNAIKYFSCRVEVREPIFCSPSLRILLSLFLFLYLSTYYVCRPLHSCPTTLSSGGGGEGTVRGTGTSTTAVPLLELTAPRKIKISGECAVARLTSLLLLVVNAVVGAAWELSPGCSVWPVLKDSYTPRTAGAVDYGGLPCALLEPMDLLHFSSFVLPCLSTPSCSLCLCFPFASLCVLGTPPTSRPPTMPYTVDLCAGAMIQSAGKAFHHVGILVGYPKDFQHLLPSDVLEVLQLDPECQYVVSKRNYGGAANLFGISNSNGNQGGIVLEELSRGWGGGIVRDGWNLYCLSVFFVDSKENESDKAQFAGRAIGPRHIQGLVLVWASSSSHRLTDVAIREKTKTMTDRRSWKFNPLTPLTAGYHHLRSWVYDTCVVRMTTEWYREVLLRLPLGIRLLDVGIGTGLSLIHNRDIVLSKQLQVVGVDCDQDYVDHARNSLTHYPALDACVDVVYASIHDYNKDYKEVFDAAYFSGSFMLMPNKVAALQHVVRMLREPPERKTRDLHTREGQIFFTQTFERSNWIGRHWTPVLKKVLKMITTIDFGEVTYEADFRAVLEEASVDILEVSTIQSCRNSRFVVVVATPKKS